MNISKSIKVRSICLRDHEVRTVLDDGVVEIVREIKPQPREPLFCHNYELKVWNDGIWCDGYGFQRKCPFGQPGDRLWVQETWSTIHTPKDYDSMKYDGWIEECEPIESNFFNYNDYHIVYKLDHDEIGYPDDEREWSWRSPVTMPRWASRLTLEVTSVDVKQIDGVWCWVVGAKEVKDE